MFAAIGQFFAMISSFCKAGEHLGNAAVNGAAWVDETSAAFTDEARAKRKQQRIQLDAKTKATEVAATA